MLPPPSHPLAAVDDMMEVMLDGYVVFLCVYVPLLHQVSDIFCFPTRAPILSWVMGAGRGVLRALQRPLLSKGGTQW